MGMRRDRIEASSNSGGPARIVLFGAGVGIGLGVWSLLTILVWEHYRGGERSDVNAPPPIAEVSDGVEREGEGARTEAQASAPSDLPEGAPVEASTRPPAPHRGGFGGIPGELKNAPGDWISESLARGARAGFLARLSFSPPGIRVESCEAGLAEDDACKSVVGGAVVGLGPKVVTLRLADGTTTVELGWEISGNRMTLRHEGHEYRFRPGHKAELLRLLKGGGS